MRVQKCTKPGLEKQAIIARSIGKPWLPARWHCSSRNHKSIVQVSACTAPQKDDY
jgi:hypothetical protein